MSKDDDISIEEAASAVAWVPGLQVDRFKLVGKIAVGGMAEIWLSRQAGPKGFEKMVVIKKILDSFLQDEGFVEMFLDEARTAAQLNHPNVVQIYDLGEYERSYFIAMEYLAGETVARLARAATRVGKPLPYTMAAYIVAHAADGLGYAHTKAGPDGKPLNIVHRDVSPQNLIVTYEGQVKVLDFGVAKAANRSTHTEAGKFKGKISYMAPEQARGLPIDGRADIFSLGIVLYELLTRSRLFQFEDPIKGLFAIASDDPIPSCQTKNAEIPDGLAAIVTRALDRDPAKRYQTAKELQSALEEWLKTQPDAPSTPTIAAFMQELFAERIANQGKMIEQIRSSDSGVIKTRSTVSGEQSMPGSSAGIVLESRPYAPLLVGLGVFMTVLLGGAGLYAITREPDPEPVKPVVLAPSSLSVESDPTGALIVLDGKEMGAAPLDLKNIELGTHTLRATAPNFEPAERTLKIERLGERNNVLLTLKPIVVAAPVKDAGQPTPKAGRGKLTLSSVPWSEVFEGSRKLGDTPLVDLTMSAGKHTLRLRNPDKGIEKTIVVEIKTGATTSLKQKL